MVCFRYDTGCPYNFLCAFSVNDCFIKFVNYQSLSAYSKSNNWEVRDDSVLIVLSKREDVEHWRL